MKVCILCPNDKIEEARKNATKVVSSDPLRIPLSATGETPATHWFCYLDVTEEGFNRLMEARQYSIIEKSEKKEFLEKYNLKTIK